MTSLQTIFTYWHYRYPNTNRFHRFGVETIDDINQAIKDIIGCDLNDKKVTGDLAKFDAICEFSNRKWNNDNMLSHINTISDNDFASILVQVRNHIIHVGEGQKGFAINEIKNIENIIRVFFRLRPLDNKDISDQFETRVTMSVINFSAKDLDRYNEFLAKNTAKTRLVNWIEDLNDSCIQNFRQASDGKPISEDNKTTVDFDGVKFKILRTNSTIYTDLPKYGKVANEEVFMSIPREVRLRIGSRGVRAYDLKPLGYCFGTDARQHTTLSLAVEGN